MGIFSGLFHLKDKDETIAQYTTMPGKITAGRDKNDMYDLAKYCSAIPALSYEYSCSF